jgi:hypothetical protein
MADFVAKVGCEGRIARRDEAEARPLFPPAHAGRQPDALELTLATQARRYKPNATRTQRTQSAAVEQPASQVYANSARSLPA